MRRALRWSALILVGALAGLVAFAPHEPVDTDVSFDARLLEGGVAAYLRRVEARYDDIRPDSAKRVIWAAGQEERQTPLSIVYLHGFSASSQEIRPVPDRLSEALGANLVFTRFRGHGRSADAMAEARVVDWMHDAAEALAVGRAVGEEVIVISTSTGGTVAALALSQPELAERVKGVIFVSPNFGIQNTLAPLLTWPGARHWLPLLAGERRSFEPRNPGQAAHWTTEYPSAAVFPMAAMVRHAIKQDYSRTTIPALFYYSSDDKVVRPDITAKVEAAWGGEVTRLSPVLTETDDPFAHVVAGDIMSPGNTGAATQAMLTWITGL